MFLDRETIKRAVPHLYNTYVEHEGTLSAADFWATVEHRLNGDYKHLQEERVLRFL